MRRLYGFIMLLALAFIGPAFSQQRWERTYGGGANEQANSVQQTADGGYIIAGWTQSFGSGNKDIYLIKTNSQGDTLWTRTYGGGSDEEGYSVQQTLDGGYIVVGWTESFNAWHGDIYLIKTNAMGDTLWTKYYRVQYYEWGHFVQQTRDSGYIIAGIQNYNFNFIYLVKTNSQGDTLWTRTYSELAGSDSSSFGYCVRQTRDGGYIVAGQKFFSMHEDAYLFRTNSQGDTLWTRNWGRSGIECFQSVLQTQDSGFIASGYSGWGLFIVRTNALGDTLWTKLYGGLSGHSMDQTMDGGYIFAGDEGSFDVFLAKCNAQGDTLWTKRYGGARQDIGRSVQQTQDGGYIIAGFTDSYGAGGQDFYLIKTDASGSSGVEEENGGGIRRPIIREACFTATPNPFTSFTRVPGHTSERFVLYDVSGRRVGTYKGDRIGEGLRAGVYFVRSLGQGGKPLRVVKIR